MFDEEKTRKKIYTPKQALLKAASYCAYQERAQQEVRDKLYEWGLHQEDVEEIISQLISDNFLNEERFAIAYTLGKLRIKSWGKIKIKQSLKLKRVSDPLIKIAFSKIDLDEYEDKLHDLLDKKQLSLKDKDVYILKNKLFQYALSRGFESDLISSLLKEKGL
ncbi:MULTISPECIES: regulatory protein RecX [Sphingobacterium]|jgi:regulatory protein|uniref:Regulatory protein RecX n=2 Tax=Sphingobacterium kitahiroshimense TaxID=470446 RepID=A0ABV0BQJ9_9SPHI|nr:MULTISPECIES: regulatory protein RecX [unclassified Sphingobacterium]MCW2260672.1 regulatory protein [Sphingobacterium kitahiroshimense]MBB2952225.1 regulatory protein [Sphingobacterium sp. JUb56]NJI75783.1 RecX family transcriptional regulator [Sphingobacterium sp. B16(2022)]QQD13918.1 RecX family transcriptional regulator [Sphingobacterium sp. UDSM-2020]TCR08971.1 regulatory protein [Sphingobacterium sp. JUb78]